ncbi:MAG: penicillin acylase family protein [Myxococcota bacterium]
MVVALLLAACREDDPTGPGAPSPLLDVAETEAWTIPGLRGPAYVVRVEGNIPYVYAADRTDLARAVGFVVARDRYFMIEMIRRLAQGRVSELLGDEGLAADQESRGIGMTRVAAQYLAQLDADPEWGPIADAYAAGINAYVAEAKNHRLPPPSELETLGPVLGSPDPVDLMTDWTRADVAAVAATLVYNLGFETTDVGRAETRAALPGLFAGAPLEAERRAGALEDLLDPVHPVFEVASAPGWGTAGARRSAVRPLAPQVRSVPAAVLDRLIARMDRVERRFGHDRESGFGSNAWAVGGYASADGRSLLAGDGHLSLSIPPLFTQIGMDTVELGGGDIHQVGLALPGLPTLAVGTNGDVAWSQTQLFGDITDWYREELRLDASGRPVDARFQGAWKPLVAIDEAYLVADVPFLGSVGRTETWTRYETFDGRLIADVEGREGTDAGPGESVINVQGVAIVPGDLDGDGVITAVSFDYAGFDTGNLILASDGFGHATDVWSFRDATKRLVAYSQNMVASDRNGDILYTGYQAVPCRGYLPRDPDGSFADGADPTGLIDGTTYGGFTIPVDADGLVDESFADDPYRCVVPFDAYPQSVSPSEGFVLTANNDIAPISFDDDLFDEPWYVGGPWLEGFRADRIARLLTDEVAAGTADLAAMSRIQGDHHSTVAERFLPTLVAAFDVARSGSDPRAAAVYARNADRFAEVEQRLATWRDADYPARAGVETFYLHPEPGDAEHAVATMIWNAWIGEFALRLFEDEALPDVFYPSGDTGRTRSMASFLDGRGPGNPGGLASWTPTTQESAFFDVLSTPERETSDELILASLEAALDALTGPSTGPGTGGFGTADMSRWLWGYRHLAKFESLLSEVVDEDDPFGFLIGLFSVTPDQLPLADDLSPTDPRAALPWFPRDGDHLNVDAGNPGFARDEWMYGSGPVFRMVIALGPDGAEGVNMLPGGQSGLVDSPYFADQAAQWLGNDTWPLHTALDQVITAATGRETFSAP